MRYIALFACVIATVISSCASRYQNSYNVYIDPALTHQAALAQSVDDWNAILSGVVTMRVYNESHVCADANDICVYSVTPDQLVQISGNPNAVGFEQTSYFETHRILLSNGFLSNDIYTMQIFEHELGHALGLGHFGNGIMCWCTCCAALRVTCPDAKAVMAEYGEYVPCGSLPDLSTAEVPNASE